MNDDQILFQFRHSGYAAPIRRILAERLKASIEDMHSNPVTEERTERTKAIRSIIDELFGDAA